MNNRPSVEILSDIELQKRYQIVSNIGTGSMGDVFLGIQRGAAGFQRLVTLKSIHRHYWQDSEDLAIFLDEASAIAILNHPHIAKTIDICRTQTSLYVVVEYVDGETLEFIRSWCQINKKSIPFFISCRLIIAACEALHHAHFAAATSGRELNIIHRDMGLHNLMIDRNGYLKVLDFTISRAGPRPPTGPNDTFQGNPAYMAPELFMEGELDHRSDIYALGLCLHELLTLGRAQSFDRGMDLPNIIHSITTNQLLPPSELVAGLPPQLDAIVAKTVAKDRSARYQTANELTHDLETFLASCGEKKDDDDAREWFNTQFRDRIEQRKRFEQLVLDKATAMVKTVPNQPSHSIAAPSNRVASTSHPSAIYSNPVASPVTGTGPSAYPTGQSYSPPTGASSLSPAVSVQPSHLTPRDSIRMPTVQPVVHGVKSSHFYVLFATLIVVFGGSIAAIYFLFYKEVSTQKPTAGHNLYIFSVPEDAAVFVDGNHVGRTSDQGVALRISPNERHRIKLIKDGYSAYTTDLTGPTEGRRNLVATLIALDPTSATASPNGTGANLPAPKTPSPPGDPAVVKAAADTPIREPQLEPKDDDSVSKSRQRSKRYQKLRARDGESLRPADSKVVQTDTDGKTKKRESKSPSVPLLNQPQKRSVPLLTNDKKKTDVPLL